MQKVVIRVTMVDQNKSRKKALHIAAATSGVESVALKGNQRDQIEVVGDIDTVELAKLLRKKVGSADVLSVGPAKQEKKNEKPAAASNESTSVALMPTWGTYPYPTYPFYVIRDPEPSCNIL